MGSKTLSKFGDFILDEDNRVIVFDNPNYVPPQKDSQIEPKTDDQPKLEQPKKEQPKPEQPKKEQPKKEQPKDNKTTPKKTK